MKYIESKIENGRATIYLIGNVDSSNAAAVEAEVNEAKGDAKSVTVDCGRLNYISSAGLRIILRLKKAVGDVEVINVSSDVYEVFEMTGFTEMMDIKKAFRRISVEGCDVIGTGGKVIREIVEKTGAKVDIEDDGTIRIAAVDQEAGKAAYEWIQNIVAEPEVGKNYYGTVCKIMEFGAFVTFMGKTDGLVHVSEMAPYRVGKVTDLLHEGDKVWVKCMGADNRGKIRLSMKCVDQKTGETIDVPAEAPKKGKKPEKPAEKSAEPVLEQTGEDLAGILGDK